MHEIEVNFAVQTIMGPKILNYPIKGLSGNILTPNFTKLIQVLDTLDETIRGEGGFGSTGTN